MRARPSPGEQPAGPAPAARPLGSEIAARTRLDNRHRRIVSILDRRPHEAGAVALSPTLLVQAMLPHRERYLLDAAGERVVVVGPGGVPTPLLATHYSATNGTLTLSIRAGLCRGPNRAHPEVSRGIPCGGLARLLLCHVVTEARKRDSRTVSLGATLTSFFERVDVTPSGGRHGRIRYVVDQLQRLATAVVDFRWDTVDGARTHQTGESLLVVDQYHFWHQGATASCEPADGGTITLSARFWNEVVSNCFPLDFRKAQLFRARPLAYDLYLWLTYRLGSLERAGRPELVLNYDQLHAQLGSHYRTGDDGRLTPEAKKNFAYHVRDAVRAIRAVWPGLEVEFPRGRLRVRATGPDVEHRAPAARS